MTTQQPIERRDNRKRAVAIGLVGLGIAGLAAASAATLSVTAAGTDNVAGGSADVTVTGPGLASLSVDLGRTATPDPVWNIDENWPGSGGTAVATLADFNGSAGTARAGTYKVAVFDTAIGGSGTHTAIASGEVDVATAGAGTVAVPLALGSGSSWGDLLTDAKSVTVVFEAA